MNRKQSQRQLSLKVSRSEDGLSRKTSSSEDKMKLERTGSTSSLKDSEMLGNPSSPTSLRTENKVDVKPDPYCRLPLISEVVTPDNDDSLVDFKSPPPKAVRGIASRDFKTIEKTRNRLTSDERPSCSKESQKRINKRVQKTAADPKQQSLESTFFKSEHVDVQIGNTCPLCLKPQKSAAAQFAHIKSCASKNNVSTKKLFDAMELQARQAEERKSLGLLPAPVQQPRKTVSRKMISSKDPQLQLGLALSMSLHELQQMEQLEEAEVLLCESSPNILEMSSEERRETLQSFGFTTNKPVAATTSSTVSKKKKLLMPTVLQTRSKVEKDQLLTEKIAEVLIGNEAITQVPQERKDSVECSNAFVLRSRLLQKYRRLEDSLWEKARLTPSRRNFYVADLSSVILPTVRGTEESIAMMRPQFNDRTDGCRHSTAGTSKELEYTADTRRETHEEKSLQTANRDSPSPAKDLAVADPETKVAVHQQFVSALASDWRNVLNVISMSDVLVFTKGDNYVWAHRLVFSVRCPDIILDITPNDCTKFPRVKDRISWPEVEHCTALAFLEFVYCGTIEKHRRIFDDETAVTGIRVLARRYRVKELFSYLRIRSSELSRLENLSETELHDSRVSEHCSSIATRFESPISANCTGLSNENNEKCKCVSSNPKTDHESSAKKRKESSSEEGNTDTGGSGTQMSEMVCANDSHGDSSDGIEVKESKEEDGKHQLPIVDFDDRPGSVSPDIFDDTVEESFSSKGEPFIGEDKRMDRGNREKFNDSWTPRIFDGRDSDNVPNAEKSPLACNENIEITLDLTQSDDSLSSGELSTIHEASNEEDSRRDRSGKTPANSSGEGCSLDFGELASTEETSKRRKTQQGAPSEGLAENSKKQKSDISVFLEKVRRINAKLDASGSDFEFESPLLPNSPKKYRNPFHIKRPQELFGYDDSVEEEKVKRTEMLGEGRNALSMFERDIRREAAKNPATFNLTSYDLAVEDDSRCPSNPSVSPSRGKMQEEAASSKKLQDGLPETSMGDDDVFYQVELCTPKTKTSDPTADISGNNDAEISMYSKYKMRHDRNSIEKYRVALLNSTFRNTGSDSTPLPKESSDDSDSLKVSKDKITSEGEFSKLCSNASGSPEIGGISLENDLDATSADLETAVFNIQHLKRSRRVDSVVNILYEEDSPLENSSERGNAENDSSNVEVSLADINESLKSKETRRNSVSRLSVCSMETEVCGVTGNELRAHSPSGEVLTEDRAASPLELETLQSAGTEVGNDSPERGNSIECIDDEKDVLHDSPVKLSTKELYGISNEVDHLLQECEVTRSQEFGENYKTCKMSSPISIHSSSDSFTDRPAAFDDKENDATTELNGDRDKLELQLASDNDCTETNSDAEEIDPDLAIYTQRNFANVTTRRTLKKSRAAGKDSIGVEEYPDEFKNASTSKSFEIRSVLLDQTSSDVETFQAKSIPYGGLEPNSRRETDFDELREEGASTSNCTPPRNRIRKNNGNDEKDESPILSAENTTPLPDYDVMKTPQLTQELHKYGIKSLKRNRAIQMLGHIYKELHPTASLVRQESSQTLSSEDEQPPPKRINNGEAPKKSDARKNIPLSGRRRAKSQNNGSNDSSGDLSSDELEFEREGRKPTSLKEAFLSVLHVDEELRTSVLTYKPLRLEKLRADLTKQGFKCTFDELVNFLDEECITSVCRRQLHLNGENRGTKRKKPSSGAKASRSKK